MKSGDLRQLMYRSVPSGDAEPDAILQASRHNNALDGITGLLWYNGETFLQVLEGSSESVGATFDRISRDPRHHSIAILSDRVIPTREFGYWSLELGTNVPEDGAGWQMERRLASLAPELRHLFR